MTKTTSHLRPFSGPLVFIQDSNKQNPLVHFTTSHSDKDSQTSTGNYHQPRLRIRCRLAENIRYTCFNVSNLIVDTNLLENI